MNKEEKSQLETYFKKFTKKTPKSLVRYFYMFQLHRNYHMYCVSEFDKGPPLFFKFRNDAEAIAMKVGISVFDHAGKACFKLNVAEDKLKNPGEPVVPEGPKQLEAEYVEYNELNKYFVCHICHGYLVQPVGIGCKHKFCKLCMESLAKPLEECPSCNYNVSQYGGGLREDPFLASLIADFLPGLEVNTVPPKPQQGLPTNVHWKLKPHEVLNGCEFETFRLETSGNANVDQLCLFVKTQLCKDSPFTPEQWEVNILFEGSILPPLMLYEHISKVGGERRRKRENSYESEWEIELEYVVKFKQ